MKLLEQVGAGQALQDAEREGRAADAAAGDAERRARFVVRQIVQLAVQLRQARVAQRLHRAVQRLVEDAAVELARVFIRILRRVCQDRSSCLGDGRRVLQLLQLRRRTVDDRVESSDDIGAAADVALVENAPGPRLVDDVVRAERIVARGLQRTMNRLVLLLEHFVHFERKRGHRPSSGFRNSVVRDCRHYKTDAIFRLPQGAARIFRARLPRFDPGEPRQKRAE